MNFLTSLMASRTSGVSTTSMFAILVIGNFLLWLGAATVAPVRARAEMRVETFIVSTYSSSYSSEEYVLIEGRKGEEREVWW